MALLRITGGRPLRGEVAVGGSKNAALPIMAASILASEPVELLGVPRLTDVAVLGRLLTQLGLGVDRVGKSLHIETVDPCRSVAEFRLLRLMRAGFCVLGPLLARRGAARVALPGGCNLGDRPVDLHLRGLAALGADLKIEHGYVVASARRLVGARIDLSGPRGPTVTGTANVLCAAALAQGRTVILGAAREPEIVALGEFLNTLGAQIDGLGSDALEIRGVEQLGGGAYRVIPDRIEAATLLIAAAITGGAVGVTGVNPGHLRSVLQILSETGARIELNGPKITLAGCARPRPVEFSARPYPGVPSDVQSQLMALLTLAPGRSIVRDEVFPERFQNVAELNRLGATIRRQPGRATVFGVDHLTGADVVACDLRSAAALVLAGLAAEGQTTIHRIEHLDRGYDRLEAKLRRLGAAIERVGEKARVPRRRTATRPARAA
ncbi:MAG: UDP-N-acetylglucosamine 1-carboxyvinyltransferase [Planctomycetes bacterium]|nr:UDP-N-acetylglucosamine 1-carboxyvinyltransferase [Planctomycetota bacterium]